MQRPTGVTVIAVLDFIGAAFCVIGGVLMFAGGAMLGSLFGAAANANGTPAVGAGVMAGMGAALGVIFLLIAALAIVVAMGLLKLKNWARITTIVLAALGLLGSIRNFIGGLGNGAIIMGVIFVAYYIWVIWYMLQPNVKQAFGQTA
jgi:hypothetical protein